VVGDLGDQVVIHLDLVALALHPPVARASPRRSDRLGGLELGTGPDVTVAANMGSQSWLTRCTEQQTAKRVRPDRDWSTVPARVPPTHHVHAAPQL
jgi:hypothetical protein